MTDGVERTLANFRDWLSQCPEPPPAPPAEPVDLRMLVAQFTALRQEVNLQTRASRSQLEQNAQTLERLGQALVQLESRPEEKDDRRLLKSLIEVRDALALAQKHVGRSREGSPSEPPAVAIELPAWARWLGLAKSVEAAIAPLREWARDQSSRRELVESLITGYTMSLQRLDRTLEQNGLERFDGIGEPFDPETMEALEVVREPGRTASEVIETVRPGYRLKGTLFRTAQVRVARPA